VIRRHRFGYRDTCFELETDLTDLYEFWVHYSARFPASGEPAHRYRALSGGGPRFAGADGVERPVERTGDLIPLVEGAFVDDLTRIAGREGDVIHAAGIAVGRRASIYLGAAGAGKSTLAVELVRAGGVLLGDDTIALDADAVIALPRPISFAAHEQPAELLPRTGDPFEAFGYEYVDREGRDRRALHFQPHAPLAATAGERFELDRVYLLERGADGPPTRRALEGTELRARLALARIRSEA
jgi:hypothetical protein